MRNILVRTVLTAGLLAGASAAKSATMTLSNWKFGAGNAVHTSTRPTASRTAVLSAHWVAPMPAAQALSVSGHERFWFQPLGVADRSF